MGARVGYQAVLTFMSDIERGACEIWELPPAAPGHMYKLMTKYRDLPMDLADASLVLLAEELDEDRILSTDERDFQAYLWKNRKPFKNLLLPD